MYNHREWTDSYEGILLTGENPIASDKWRFQTNNQEMEECPGDAYNQISNEESIISLWTDQIRIWLM